MYRCSQGCAVIFVAEPASQIMRILIIEDEPRMLELLRRGLEEHDCFVVSAPDGLSGLEFASTCDFDAILLDVGLPHRDGYEVVRILRERARATPVLMLTARDGEDDIIRGLELGADDYMTKPFSFPELVARLQSITRSRREDTSSRMEVGDLMIDPMHRSVKRKNKAISLTPSEFSLLVTLARSAGRCVSRHALMESVWGSDTAVGAGALDVLVSSLRGKIDTPNEGKAIGTVRGEGYIIHASARIAGRSL
jgi:DNA-binding response OmpR family regulator